MKLALLGVVVCSSFSVIFAADSDKLLETVKLDRIGFFRSCSVNSPLPGSDYRQSNETIYYSSGINYPCSNGIMSADSAIPSEAEIEQAIAYFGSRKLPFMWWTEAKNLEQKGFCFGGYLKGIAVNIVDTDLTQDNTNVQVKQITSNDDIKIFSQLIVDAFGMDPSALEQFCLVSVAATNKGEQVHFLAYVDGKPAGTATLSKSEAAGIWNLSTLPEFRKQGVGTALVKAAMLEAKKCHYEQMMAMLMPKGMAWGLFTRLGYKEVCQYPFYIYGASPEELEK